MSAPATLDRPDAPKSAKAGAAETKAPAGCPKCGNLESWGMTSWCPKCGYYPRLGTSVETDDPASKKEEAPPPAGYMDALRRLPRWAVVLASGVLAIILVSIAVRALTDEEGFARSAWSLMQLFIGGTVFVVVHTYAFFKAGAKAKVGGFDIVIRPLEVWRPSFQELPATARRIWLGAWGFTAVLGATLIIGAIRYSALTDDWGFKARPKQNLIKKIKEQAMENAEDGAKSLDDAIKDFAGDEELKKKPKKKKEESDLDWLSAECLVVGYNVDKKTGQLRDLILASLIDEKLQFAGIVSGELPLDIQKELQEKLPLIEQEKPFVKCPVTARWVKPVVSCRAKFKEWNKSKRMEKPVLKELLDEVKVK